MNYRKFTNETDFYSQKDALACGHVNFSFKMTEKKKKKKKKKTLGLFFQKFYIFPRKLDLFHQLSTKKINGTSTPTGIKINFSSKNYMDFSFFFKFESFFFIIYPRKPLSTNISPFKDYF